MLCRRMQIGGVSRPARCFTAGAKVLAGAVWLLLWDREVLAEMPEDESAALIFSVLHMSIGVDFPDDLRIMKV